MVGDSGPGTLKTVHVQWKKHASCLLKHLAREYKTKAFHDYFTKEWSHKTHQWAYCHWLVYNINTNMFVVDAFHRVSKRIYLDGKLNKLLDKYLVNLIKFVRDKSYD